MPSARPSADHAPVCPGLAERRGGFARGRASTLIRTWSARARAPPTGAPGATTVAYRPHRRRVRQTSLPRHSGCRSTERPLRFVVDHTVRPSPAVPSREGTPTGHDQHQRPARNPPSALERSLRRSVRERRSATDNRLTKLGGPFARGHRGPFSSCHFQRLASNPNTSNGEGMAERNDSRTFNPAPVPARLLGAAGSDADDRVVEVQALQPPRPRPVPSAGPSHRATPCAGSRKKSWTSSRRAPAPAPPARSRPHVVDADVEVIAAAARPVRVLRRGTPPNPP